MRQKSVQPESPSERLVKNIRRATRKRHSSEEKIRIVLDGLRGESSIAELCRREGIAESLYYAWSKKARSGHCSDLDQCNFVATPYRKLVRHRSASGVNVSYDNAQRHLCRSHRPLVY